MKNTNRTPAIAGGTPCRTTFLPFAKPCISEQAIEDVSETLRSGWLTTGNRTAAFEARFAEYVGQQHAVGTSCGTAALAIALTVAEIGPGDEVITTPMTFVATTHQILQRGALPVLVDIDRHTLNLDVEALASKLTPRTKAILPVHFAGRPCDMAAIRAFAKANDLLVISDSAHAIESKYREKPLAHWADISAFSFHANKNLTTGEGGMVTTNSDKWTDELRELRFHGIRRNGLVDVVRLAGKCNMNDIQATLGLHQLKSLDERAVFRNQLTQLYNDGLQDLKGIQIPAPVADGNQHAWHMYNILITADGNLSRDHFMAAMMAENIGVGLHYTSVHELTYYRNRLGYRKEDFPNSSYVSDRIVTLPLHAAMTTKDCEDVIEAVAGLHKYYCTS